ncbi:g8299 [Coccomyxa viridis]|uniref:G8299 protein n=1 Tax=Coccomyxa viridis TaxID=1274662 RepID=A0ABP1G6I1_9CHLO
MSAPGETFVGPRGETRLRHTEFVFPVVVGTCAFYLGKKATETQSHKWYLYLRGLNNEDIGHIVKKAVFNLHPTFPNPQREVTAPPFEIEEHGWGEFEVNVVLHFADDSQEQPIEIYHKLKLYDEADPNNPSAKKPVLNEQYEELIFSEPVQSFFNRVTNYRPGQVHNPSGITAHFRHYAPDEDMQRLTAARQRVAVMSASVHRQAEMLA